MNEVQQLIQEVKVMDSVQAKFLSPLIIHRFYYLTGFRIRNPFLLEEK